jgi:quercetin dioxygenase-like cupin family protein
LLFSTKEGLVEMAFNDLHLPSNGNRGPEGQSTPRAVFALCVAAAIAVAVVGYGFSLALLQRESAQSVPEGIHDMGHMMAGDAPADAAGRPVTAFKPISCQKLPNVPGKTMTVALVEFPPNGFTPRHRHPGSVMAFVVKGTLRSQLEGEPPETYTTGQTWFEPPGAVHLFAENASKTEPATILATFVADDDCGALTIPG